MTLPRIAPGPSARKAGPSCTCTQTSVPARHGRSGVVGRLLRDEPTAADELAVGLLRSFSAGACERWSAEPTPTPARHDNTPGRRRPEGPPLGLRDPGDNLEVIEPRRELATATRGAAASPSLPSGAELLHPRARPGKLVGIGLNYPTTNREVALDTPAAAVTLAKFASTVGAAVVSGTRP